MRLLRFIVVGGFSALIQFLVLALCLQILAFEYHFAISIAYFASVIFHFLANRYFTFRLDGVPHIDEILRYTTIVIVNFIITILITSISVELINLTPYFATVLSIIATVGIAFLSSKYWIFKQRKSI